MAKVLKGQFGKTAAGTPFYAGPEIWKHHPQYLSLDVWSLGCILYEMLTYRPPFQAQNMAELSHQILNDQINDIPIEFSQELNLFLKKLL